MLGTSTLSIYPWPHGMFTSAVITKEQKINKWKLKQLKYDAITHQHRKKKNEKIRD